MKLTVLITASVVIGVLLTLGIGMSLDIFGLSSYSQWALENGGYKVSVTIITPLIFYLLYSRPVINNWFYNQE